MTTVPAASKSRPVESIKHRNPDAYDPFDLHLVGHDSEGDPSDPLYDPERIKEAVKKRPNDIRSILLGIPVPPVICVKRIVKGRERLDVKDGRTRTMDLRYACEEADKKGEPRPTVQVVVHHGMSDDDHAIGVVSYNHLGQRETPVQKAFKVARLLARLNDDFDRVRIAANVKSASALRGYKKFVAADAAIIRAAEKGPGDPDGIGIGAACMLAHLPREQQVAALKSALASGAKSVHDIAAQVKALGTEVEEVEGEAGEGGPASASPEKAKSPKPADPNRDLAGRPPKRRFLTRVMERISEDVKDGEGLTQREKEDLELVRRTMLYQQKANEPPPAVFAKYVRAEKAAEMKRKEKKAEKAKETTK